jgi:hypothetical protein
MIGKTEARQALDATATSVWPEAARRFKPEF